MQVQTEMVVRICAKICGRFGCMYILDAMLQDGAAIFGSVIGVVAPVDSCYFCELSASVAMRSSRNRKASESFDCASTSQV